MCAVRCQPVGEEVDGSELEEDGECEEEADVGPDVEGGCVGDTGLLSVHSEGYDRHEQDGHQSEEHPGHGCVRVQPEGQPR